MPEGTRRDQFLAWIDALPDKQSPDWLGLPTNAETVLLTNLGKATIIKLLKMQQLDEVIYTKVYISTRFVFIHFASTFKVKILGI